MEVGQNYINGQWQESRSDFVKYSPIFPSQKIGEYPLSTINEVEQAVMAARKAQKSWEAIGRVQRGEYFDRLCQIIKKRHQEIVELITIETGKNPNESHAEVIEALHMAQYTFGKARMPMGDVVSSELSERDSYVIRKPKGVIAIISPWNFPAAIGGFWNAAPALLEGNTIVFKPSELTPATGQLTAELYHEAGFPPGTFNLIHGAGGTGNFLVHADVNHICFTGSVDVGTSIRRACAASLSKTCSCEMGSKSAVIVFDDCDIDLAVQAAVNSAFKLSGQRCVSAGRVLVQRGILENFKQDFVAAVANVKLSNWISDKDYSGVLSIGPLISETQKANVQKYADMILNDKDTKVLYKYQEYYMESGEPIMPSEGHYFGPLVYECEWDDKPYLKQEIFGPVVGIIPFDTTEDAVRIYNDTNYGLAVGVCTNDYRVMREMRDKCDAGMIYFNLGSIGAESQLPFSGVKMSGYGYGSAAGTFDAVVHKISVTYNHAEQVTFPQGLK